jgi:hypothetical protein
MSPTSISSIDAAPEIPGDIGKPMPGLDVGASIPHSSTPVVDDGGALSNEIIVPDGDYTELVYEPQDDLKYVSWRAV